MFELIQIVASIFTCIGIIIALFEFHFMKKSTVAEHERIQKQATIDYYNSICEKLYSLNHVIYEKYKRDRINYSEIKDDEEFLSVIKTYLNTMEILATGINTGIYNIHVFDRLYGDVCVRVGEQLEDYIANRRSIINEPEMYKEFDSLVMRLKKVHRTRKDFLDERVVIKNKVYNN